MLGLHWVVDATGCDPSRLTSACVREALIELPRELGLTPIGAPQILEHREDGVLTIAGVVLITESHASCHAFPGDAAVHVDVFSCKAFDVETARRFVRAHFGARELLDSVLCRGETSALDGESGLLARRAR